MTGLPDTTRTTKRYDRFDLIEQSAGAVDFSGLHQGVDDLVGASAVNFRMGLRGLEIAECNERFRKRWRIVQCPGPPFKLVMNKHQTK